MRNEPPLERCRGPISDPPQKTDFILPRDVLHSDHQLLALFPACPIAASRSLATPDGRGFRFVLWLERPPCRRTKAGRGDTSTQQRHSHWRAKNSTARRDL